MLVRTALTLLVVSLLAAPGLAVDLSGVGQFIQRRPNGFAREYCVGTFVETSRLDAAPAYVVSNAHCFGFFLSPKRVRYGQPADMAVMFTVRNIEVKIVELAYGSMNGTDRALYKLDKTVGELRSAGVRPLPLASGPASVGEKILRAQSHSESYSCEVDAVGVRLREERYEYDDSYRYFCYARHGSSGSPLILPDRGVVVGVHNIGRATGGKCTIDDPCELDGRGRPVKPPSQANYGQRVDVLKGCFDAQGVFDRALPGCGPL